MRKNSFAQRLGVAVSTAAIAVWGFPALASVTATSSTITNYIPDGTITIDNDFSDWDADWKVIDESDEADVDYIYECFVPGVDEDWHVVDSASDCAGGYTYNEQGQLDLLTGYFGINETSMYVGFENAWPMMAVYDVDADEYMSIYMLPFTAGITTLPQAFDHTMVFAFGPADEETFTYYLVAQISAPEDLSSLEEGGGNVSLLVYEESGDSVGYDDADTLLGTMDEDSETSNDSGENLQGAFEVRQNVETFLALTGMDPLSEYGFRMETHSDDGDITDRVVVSFESTPSIPENVAITALKKRSAKVTWDAVDGADYYKVQLSKKKSGDRIKTFKHVNKLYKTIDKAYMKKGRMYKARVAACNDAGCSEWSAYEAFQTKSE